MKFKTTVLIACIASLLLTFAATADTAQEVKTIIDKAPAANPADIYKNAAELVKLGPLGVTALCDMVIEPGTGENAKVRYALDGLAVYVARPNAEAERKMFVTALIKSLDKADNKEVKHFLIERLQRAGKEESVGAISKYLADDRLCERASMALQAIATDNAAAALAKALPNAKGNNLITIITALGNLKCKAVAKDILPYAKSDNAVLRLAALNAIANIADPSAGKALATATRAKGSYERSKANSYYILYAQRLAEDGNKGQSAKICRGLVGTGQGYVKCAALSTLVSVEGAKALDDILSAAKSDDLQVRAAALSLGNKIPGKAATAKWVALMDSSSSAIKANIITMLALRGDKSALEGIITGISDGDKEVRTAAIDAAVKLGENEAIDPVLSFMKKSNDADEIKYAATTLNRLKGDTVLASMAKALSGMNQYSKIAIIEALATRKAKAQSAAVFAQVNNSNASVRSAAIKALDNVATAKDIDALIAILNGATSGSDKSAAQTAIVAAAEQIDDPQNRAAKVLPAMQAATGDKKIALIQVLGRIGGKAALGAVVTEAAGDDKAIEDAAVRALTSWPETEALPQLVSIVENTANVTHRVLALRGIVRLINAGQLPAENATKIYAQALSAVDRAEDKKLIIAGLGNIKTIDSLRLVENYLYDDALKTEAAIAACKIALPQRGGDKGLTQYQVGVVLKKAVTLITDAKTIEQVQKHIKSITPSANAEIVPVPEGFVALFNSKDLTGWKALLHSPNDNPAKRAQLTPEKHAELQAKEDEAMRTHWTVKDGVLYFDGKGFSLATAKDYTDFEMLVDWKIVEPRGDSGIYLRGTPQVQIWDPDQHKLGSGGLYNNKKKENPAAPTKIADNPIGTWNTFRIKMIGEKVSVHLNGELVVDNVVLENYWDRSIPIFPKEQIELQCHGNPIEFANIFIRELPKKGEFRSLFNGRDLAGWIGDTKGYLVEDGVIVCKPGGNLYTEEQFDNFHFKFDFKLTPGANNGLGIRTPSSGDAAYSGMELQILDNTADMYKNLQPYQYHGSIYGVVPAKRGFLKPVGEWNHQEVIANGRQITVILNGETIVDADIDKASEKDTADHRGRKGHPGLARKGGHIGFLGHGSVVYFKNMEISGL